MVDLNHLVQLKRILDNKKANYAFLHTTLLYPVPDNLEDWGALEQNDEKHLSTEYTGYSDPHKR